MANSVVSLVELMFPKTIDKLQKEMSELDGPKPICINECSESNLQKLLMSLQLLQPNIDANSQSNSDQS